MGKSAEVIQVPAFGCNLKLPPDPQEKVPWERSAVRACPEAPGWHCWQAGQTVCKAPSLKEIQQLFRGSADDLPDELRPRSSAGSGGKLLAHWLGVPYLPRQQVQAPVVVRLWEAPGPHEPGFLTSWSFFETNKPPLTIFNWPNLGLAAFPAKHRALPRAGKHPSRATSIGT